MHASVRREVQSKVSGRGSDAYRLPPQAHESSSQDLPYLGQALLRRHQIGRQGIDVGKAAIGLVKTETGWRAHFAAARSRYRVSL
jgi:hypothetical protein